MGFFSSLFSAVCSFVSSFVASVGSIVMKAINVVSAVVEGVGKALGLIKPDENIEDLGDRTLQAGEAGINPENYEKYDDYLAAIRNFELDPVKTEKFSTEEKQMAGLATTCRGIEDKFDLKEGTAGSLAALIALDKGEYFTSDRLTQWFSEPSLDKEKLVDMFNSKLTPKESIELGSQVMALEKQNNPEKSEQAIQSEFMEARNTIANGGKE